MKQLVRLRFSKRGKVRFTSHRDVARMWERALRRAEVAVAYSEGFSPRPKLSFGLALPTGHESLGEYLDVELAAGGGAPDLDSLQARLDPALPVGLDVQGGTEIEPGTPSLQQAVQSCTWRIEVTGSGTDQLVELVAGALASPALTVTRERKGRVVVDDIRPDILSLVVTGPGTLVAELATQPRGLRPAELVAALGGDVEPDRVLRMHQWILAGGAKREPVPVTVTAAANPAPHAQARAS
jgi:radical SAM-linked protein